MELEFNRYNKRYNDYNLFVGAGASKQVKKTEEETEVEKANNEFIGLENDTDLLTQNAQYLYETRVGNFVTENKTIADETNKILASLGYGNYKVTAAQVASITNGVEKVVMPGLKTAEDGAVAANIQDPNGPFADLFI